MSYTYLQIDQPTNQPTNQLLEGVWPSTEVSHLMKGSSVFLSVHCTDYASSVYFWNELEHDGPIAHQQNKIIPLFVIDNSVQLGATS